MIKFNGRVLYLSKDNIYMSNNYKIYKSSDSGLSWKVWIVLPISLFDKIMMSIPLVSRLLRKAIHHVAIVDGIGVIIANKSSFLVKDMTITEIEPLHGSRPMVLCQTEFGEIYYGEYRSNPERGTVSIWKLNKLKTSWETVWSFNNVRHVHGVFYDKHTNSTWVTTGDNNEEAGIYVSTDNFQTLDKIVGGSQQFRAVQLLFDKEYIYFGSDAPDEVNYIYRMQRDGTGIEQLVEVGSSVFYGFKVDSSYFFSTAIEPSICNNSKYVELWKSDNGFDWYLYKKIKKDIWSMKYFQYGQILFPNGNNNSLYYTPFATVHSGKSYYEKDIE